MSRLRRGRLWSGSPEEEPGRGGPANKGRVEDGDRLRRIGEDITIWEVRSIGDWAEDVMALGIKYVTDLL